jgi:hypothetical protein
VTLAVIISVTYATANVLKRERDFEKRFRRIYQLQYERFRPFTVPDSF